MTTRRQILPRKLIVWICDLCSDFRSAIKKHNPPDYMITHTTQQRQSNKRQRREGGCGLQ